MRKEDFMFVLASWKEFTIPEMVSRETGIADIDKITTIVGVRRCGKTYLVFRHITDLLKTVNKDNIFYINFEHERLRNLDANDLDDLLVAYRELFEPDATKPIYMFLDEIQNIPGWDKWVRRIYDSRKYRLIITGSSSVLLSKEIATALGGRSISTTIFPLSFKEYLNAKGYVIPDIKTISYTDRRGTMLKHLKQYMLWGGFPEVVLEPDKNNRKKILASYFDAIFYKDIITRFGLKNISLLENFIRYALKNSSSYFSLSKTEKFFKTIGIKGSKRTLSNYLKYVESVFLLFPIEIYSHKIKDKLQYPHKLYAIDTGLLNVVNPAISKNYGPLAENIVFLDLKRRFSDNPAIEINYWKNRLQKEVDFVIKESLAVKYLIQVCWDIKDEITRKREETGLLDAMDEFGIDTGFILTEDLDDKQEFDNKKIIYIPIWKWLISKLPK